MVIRHPPYLIQAPLIRELRALKRSESRNLSRLLFFKNRIVAALASEEFSAASAAFFLQLFDINDALFTEEIDDDADQKQNNKKFKQLFHLASPLIFRACSRRAKDDSTTAFIIHTFVPKAQPIETIFLRKMLIDSPFQIANNVYRFHKIKRNRQEKHHDEKTTGS
jgi:hypothetical protein